LKQEHHKGKYDMLIKQQ